jgi:hypothetical protein
MGGFTAEKITWTVTYVSVGNSGLSSLLLQTVQSVRTMQYGFLKFLRQESSSWWFVALVSIATLLTCSLAFSLPFAEPDLWGHVQFGRDVLEYGLPRTTSYSFTADGYTWINHENLSEVAFALSVDQFGVWSLLAGKCLLGLVIVAAIGWRARRRGVSWLVIATVSLLFSATIGSYWQVRPQLVSFGCFALLLLLLDAAFRGWQDHWHLPWCARLARHQVDSAQTIPTRRLHWLWLAAPLFALWANAHGGFVAGYCIFVAYLLARCAEFWIVQRRESLHTIGLLSAVAIVAGLSTLATPYGIDLHRWLLSSLHSPRPEITEWHPLGLDSEALIPFVVLGLATVAALALSRRPLDATHLLLLGLIGWQAVTHQRHVPFAAMAACFWLPAHWQSLWKRFQCNEDEAVDFAPARWLQFTLLGVNVLLIGLLCSRLSYLRVDKSHYPVAAVEFMRERELTGRLVVTYNWAQYAIAALGTRDDVANAQGVKVSFDGRFRTCYPQSLVDEHFDFVLGANLSTLRQRSTDRIDVTRTLRTGTPDLVLISRLQSPAVEVMQQQTAEWVMLYQDSLAQLWGRRSKYDNPESPNYIAADRRVLNAGVQVGLAAWPALPPPSRNAARLAGPSQYDSPLAVAVEPS